MKKTSKSILVILLKLLAVSLLFNAAYANTFDENVHFTSIIPEPGIGKPGDKIEVIEFFMHSCPHCYDFEPEIKAWLKAKPDDIEFVQIPALFGRHTDMHAETYYALEAIGEIDRLQGAIFHAIHNERNRLKTREQMDAFLLSQKVDMVKFRGALSSFAVKTKINRARTLLERYAIRSVPSLVIDGRYKNASGLAHKEMTALIDFLAEKVRQQRKEEAAQ